MTQAVAIEAARSQQPYRPRHAVRIVTAAALFDGHDAAINVMRRILQASGAEVIHLGHNRSVAEIVDAAVQEDAQGVAITSYQGGHMEYFTLPPPALDERGAGNVRIYGGGGGVIVPTEIEELHARGIDRIFSPEDGRRMGLQGMIDVVLARLRLRPARSCRRRRATDPRAGTGAGRSPLRRAGPPPRRHRLEPRRARRGAARATTAAPVVGLTGTGGAGKSSLSDELVRRFARRTSRRGARRCSAWIPTKRRTGGALLGDRIRFNSRSTRASSCARWPRAARGEVVRGAARRGRDGAGAAALRPDLRRDGRHRPGRQRRRRARATLALRDDRRVRRAERSSRRSRCSTTPTSSRSTSSPAAAAEDALRDVRKQVQRNRKLFGAAPEELPVFGTSAAHFNDAGVNALYATSSPRLDERLELGWASRHPAAGRARTDPAQYIIPPDRERYLAEIAAASREHRGWARRAGRDRARAEALDARDRARRRESGADAGGSGAGDAGAGLPPRWPTCVRSATRRSRGSTPSARGCSPTGPRWDGGLPRRALPLRGARPRGRGRDTAGESLSEHAGAARSRCRATSGAGDRLRWRLLENVPGRVPVHRRRLPVQAHAARTRRACSPARARPSAPTAASTSSPTGSPRSGSPPPSTPSRSTARTPPGGPTSTARSARAASRSSRSRRPSGSTPASTSATRRPRCR